MNLLIPASAARLLSTCVLIASQSACIILVDRDCGGEPYPPQGDIDNDGDGYTWAIDCDDWDANIGEDCGDDVVDSDGDGISDLDEEGRGTDPWNVDTDGDGWLDNEERDCGSSPLDPFLTCEDAPAEGEGEGEVVVDEEEEEEDCDDEAGEGEGEEGEGEEGEGEEGEGEEA